MTDNTENRIRLAEWMGWVPTTIYTSASGRRDVTRWRSPKGRTNIMLPDLPNPFTDANDDYAVLEWMREQVEPGQPYGEPSWPFLGALKGDLQIAYRVGDYARAALKVIDHD